MYIIRKDEGSRSNVMITNTDNNRTTNLGPLTSRMIDILKDNDIADLTITGISGGFRLMTENKEAIEQLAALTLHRHHSIKTITPKMSLEDIKPKVVAEPVNALDIFAQFM